jgi:hypothetical protein
MATDTSRCDGEDLTSAVSPMKLMAMRMRKNLEILAMTQKMQTVKTVKLRKNDKTDKR